jgi:hypothetical protein
MEGIPYMMYLHLGAYRIASLNKTIFPKSSGTVHNPMQIKRKYRYALLIDGNHNNDYFYW